MIRVATLAAAAAALALAAPAAAHAQTASASSQSKGLTAGATVYGPSGEAAGTVESINGTVVVLSTGTNKLNIPADRIGAGDKGPVIGLERAQLDAIAEQGKAKAAAQLQAALQPGAPVRGNTGMVLGSVKEIDAESNMVTLTAEAGGEVRVPASGFTADANGLKINMDADSFAAAVAASTSTAQ